MSDVKIAPEMAELEFERFVEVWDLDGEVAEMEEEDRVSFNGLKRKLMRVLISGDLVVNEDATLTYCLRYPTLDSLKELKFEIPKGDAMVSWDKFKDRQNIAKLNSFIGSMTRQSPAIFAAVDGRDLKICQAVALLFLGS